MIYLLLLSCSFNSFAQIRNKFDIHVAYAYSQIVTSLNNSYIDDEFMFEFPTVLGNLEANNGFEIGVLYSDLSYYIQPGIYFSRYVCQGNSDLPIKINTNIIGISCKVNLIKYGARKVIPYAKPFVGYTYSTLRFSDTEFILEKNDVLPNSSYEIIINTDESPNSYFNPLFGINIGVETTFSNNLLVFSELGFSLLNYPDFDIPSPSLINHLSLLAGFRYKFKKDKKYLYR